MTDLLIFLLILVLFLAWLVLLFFALGSAMNVISEYRSEVEREEMKEYFDRQLIEREDDKPAGQNKTV